MRRSIAALLLAGCGVFAMLPDGTRELPQDERVLWQQTRTAWREAGFDYGARCRHVPSIVELPLDEAHHACWRRPGTFKALACYRRPARGASYIVRSVDHPAPERVLVHEFVHALEDCAGPRHYRRPCAEDRHCDPARWGPVGVEERASEKN